MQEIHFTIALGHMGQGLASERLNYIGFQYECALAKARAIVGTGTETRESTDIPFSDGVNGIIAAAQKYSLRDGLWYFGTDHLFLALMEKPEALIQQLVEAKGLALDEFRAQTQNIYSEALKNSLLHSKPIS